MLLRSTFIVDRPKTMRRAYAPHKPCQLFVLIDAHVCSFPDTHALDKQQDVLKIKKKTFTTHTGIFNVQRSVQITAL